MQVTVSADLSVLGRFAKTLDKAEASVIRWRVRQVVKDVGDDMLRAARANAAWSSRIPAATTLKTSFGARTAGVTMRTDPKKAPYAFYYERGSRGSGGRYVKHPVFGSQNPGARADVRARYDNKATWRATPTRPFFYKSGIEHRELFARKMREQLDAAMHELGFH